MRFAELKDRIFSVPSGDRRWYSIIFWWELRRPVYNLIVGLGGVVGLAIFAIINELPPERPFSERDWEPMAVFVFAIAANVFYTGGWATEILARAIWKEKAENFGPIALGLGIIFSVLLAFLPATVEGIVWVVRGLR